jgi:O-antigen/teichoic acid export membrane protein
MSSVKQKTISGLLWSFTEQFATQAVTFIVGIVLARLLSPEEFGLIGMLTIFIGFAGVFVQSGFNQALIRKTDCTEKDYATVFYFNLFVALVFYGLLVLTSGLISDFYDEPILQDLIKVLGLTLVINALTIVQRTKITKRVDFKLLTKVSLIASIGSGILGITLAATGFGVWSLVYRQIAQRVFEAAGLWLWNKWKPRDKFSKTSLKELWAFSGNLVGLAVIDIIYKNIYYVIIGKFYPAANLGQYRQADTFRKLPSETLGNVIDRVSFPVLSSIQENKQQYNATFERLLKSTMLLSFVLLIGLAAVAKELTVVLMGAQWALAGEYLQILAFSAMFYPLGKLLNSLLKIAGHSDLILKIGIIEKIFAIPVILTAIFIGIKPMLYLMIAERLSKMILLSNYSIRYAGMTSFNLFKKIMPSFTISILMFFFLISLDLFINSSPIIMLGIKIITGVLMVFGLFELFKLDDYVYLKKETINKIKFIIK